MENSPFSKLAPEIRNRIWQYTVTFSQSFGFYDNEDLWGDDWEMIKQHMAETNFKPLAISETYKAIRNETTQMFYAVNTFRFGFPSALECCRLNPPSRKVLELFAPVQAFQDKIGTRNSAVMRKGLLRSASILLYIKWR